jgi:hypothetical protein
VYSYGPEESYEPTLVFYGDSGTWGVHDVVELATDSVFSQALIVGASQGL